MQCSRSKLLSFLKRRQALSVEGCLEREEAMTEQELIALIADAIEDADTHLCSEGEEPPYEKMAMAAIEAIRSAIQETKLGQT
jgi:hypothetical protein